MPHVMLTWYATADEIARVRRGLPKGSTVWAPKARAALSRFETRFEDLAAAAPKADAIMGWVVPPGIWDKAARFKALAWLHAGCDELDFVRRERGVQRARRTRVHGSSGMADVHDALEERACARRCCRDKKIDDISQHGRECAQQRHLDDAHMVGAETVHKHFQHAHRRVARRPARVEAGR